jgi:hypothetical protein
VSFNVFLPPSSKFLLFSESALRFSKTVGGKQSKLSNLEREARKKRESQSRVRERTRKRERERERERRTRRRRGFRNPKTFFERLPYDDDDDSGVSESSGNQSVSKTCAADFLSESQQIRFADQKKLLSEEEASAKQKTRKVVPAAAAVASACVGFFGRSSCS